MIRSVLFVGLGGGLGSILRFLLSILIKQYNKSDFPLSTLIVNILGCFLIGLLIGYFERQQIDYSDLKYLLVIGFCGGFTTFSSFAFENIHLLTNNNIFMSILYITASVIICLLAVALGLQLVK